MKTEYPNFVRTPADIKPAYFGILVDCGLTLVHDLDGKPRNYLHEISVSDNPEAIRQLNRDGYERKSGHQKSGVQVWHFVKRFPLTVSKW